MADNSKLSTVIDSYTYFERDQVLTPDQLNGLMDYMDRQARLTRVRALGTGIKAGLHVALSSDGSTLTVSRGSAITTDGDLLSLGQDVVYSHFTSFVDKNAQYAQFVRDGAQIPLYELTSSGSTGESLTNFTKGTGVALADTAVLLYMESFRLSQNICTGGNCDNKGQLEKNNFKVLIARKSDLEKLSGPICFSLQAPTYKRILLDPKATDHMIDLVKAYDDGSRAMVNILSSLLPATYTAAQGLLTGLYENDPTASWITKLKTVIANAGAVTSGIQYTGIQNTYDFLLDVMDGYDQLRESLFTHKTIDWTKVTPFPKHVMAGSILVEGGVKTDPYRHGFYPSETAVLDGPDIRELRFYHKRIDLMIKSFDITTATEHQVRVMPRKGEKEGGLCRPLPCYYTTGGDESIADYWDYTVIMKRMILPDFGFLPRIGRFDLGKQLSEPSDWRGPKAEFFWIDGHIGQDVEEVEKTLNNIASMNDLSFQVRTIQVENDVSLLPLKPRRPIFRKDLNTFFNIRKNALVGHLDDLADFNSAVVGTISSAVKDTTLPARNPLDAKSSFELFTNKNAEKLTEKTILLREKLKVTLDDFDHEDFEKEFTETIGLASDLNKGVKGITWNSAFTPYETVTGNPVFKDLSWIKDILVKRREKIRLMTLFGSFIQDHPGMTHMAGVPAGGTFILAYLGTTKKVIADFALPYWVTDQVVEEEQEDPVIPGILPPKWTGLNDLVIHLNKDQYFEDKIVTLTTDIQAKLEGFKVDIAKNAVDLHTELNNQVSSVSKAYSDGMGVLVNSVGTIIKAKEAAGITINSAKDSVAGSFSNEDYAGAAEVIEAAKNYRINYEKKVNAGTATDEDKEIMASFDNAAAKAITRSVKSIASRQSDVEVASEEAKFIEYANNSMDSIKDEGARKGVSTEVTRIMEANPTKTNLSNQIKNMR
jgi:hypothetical protein